MIEVQTIREAFNEVQLQLLLSSSDNNESESENNNNDDAVIDSDIIEYLESLLQDEDSYDDLEALTDALTDALHDNRQLAINLIKKIISASSSASSDSSRRCQKEEEEEEATRLPQQQPQQQHPSSSSTPTTKRKIKVIKDRSDNEDDDDDDGDESSEASSSTGSPPPTTTTAKGKDKGKGKPLSKAAQRKEERRKKREEKAKKKRTKKGKKTATTTKKQKDDDANTTTTTTTTTDNNINQVVAKLNAESAAELNELDDYSSAWNDVKAKAALENKDEVIWGGRGFGGRGVNRGLGVYKGKDAVVQQLTLSYEGGRDLLQETHLSITHKHRYGLMGHNGVGKTTLLRRIANQHIPGWPLHLSVMMVEQEVLGTTQSVIEVMKSINNNNNNNNSDKRKNELEEEIADLETVLENPNNTSPEDMESAAERLSELYEQLDEIDNNDSNNNNSNSDDNNDDNKKKDDTTTDNNNNPYSELDSRAKKILKGLQFPNQLLEVPGDTLSGGWRMRLALAKALYVHPDILLLDEPTNHLDISAVLFLEKFIIDNNMTVMVVSHDSYFLDAICTDMIKFENCKLKYHVGNYTSYCEMENQLFTRNTNKADAVARKEKKTMEFIQKQRSMVNSKHRDDNKQKQAAERAKKFGRIGLFADNGQKFKLLAEGNTKRGGSNRAGHIYGSYTNSAGFRSAFVSEERHALEQNHQRLNFRFVAAPPLKGGGNNTNLITMEDCRFRYHNNDYPTKDWLLQDMTLNVSYGSRIAIVGKNGAGKSTLLKLLCGELNINKGEFHTHPNLKIAYIAQHHIEQLANYLECTPVEYFIRQHKAKDVQEARKFLGDFGLVGNLALQKIGTLSGGQKARLAFATVLFDPPQLLVLDEPTNHLDFDSLESLAKAVEKFEGGVIIVSHNQQFMSRVCNEMWTVGVGNGKVKVDHVVAVTNTSSENAAAADPAALGHGIGMMTFDDAYEQYKNQLRKELK